MLRFLTSRKGLIVFHEAGEDLDADREWDGFNHLHLVWWCEAKKLPRTDSIWQVITSEYVKVTGFNEK